jgi:hypothetical protein
VLTQEEVLVGEDDYVILASVKGVVVCSGSRSIVPLNNELVGMTHGEARRGKEVSLKHAVIIRGNSKCECD